MAELAIAIPEPIAEDPENVVTALETAALFGARGDASEALRWVRTAATSAGESGRDSRALDLARAAADLTPAPPEVAARARSLPAPPSRPSALPPPLPEVAPPASSSARPPPPSASRPEQRARPSHAPRPWPVASERPSAAARERPSVAPRASAAPSERSSVAPRASAAPRERASVAPRAVAPNEHSSAVPSESSAGARNAARVCVTPESEPGVFLVRVLADGAPAPSASVEGFLVLADPQAKLFSNR